MAVLKPSNIPWIGDIPQEWRIIKLKYASQLKGRIGWQGLTTDEYRAEGPYLVTGTDFDNGVVNWERCQHVSEERYQLDIAIQIKEDDLLITKDGTIGKVAVSKNCPEKVCLNSGIFIIRNTGDFKYNSRFMYYVLQSEELQRWFSITDRGNSTIKHLTQEKFYNFSFAYPAIDEQQAIASYLDDRCSKLDEIITEAEKSIEDYKELKQAVIFEAVTKGLDKNAPMKDSGFHWVGNIPSHWKMMKLKYLLDKSDAGIKVGPFGSSFTNKTVGDGDYLIYGQANVISRDFSKTKNSVTADVYHALSRYDVVSGDICLSVIGNGTIGWCCTVPENIKPGIMDSHLMKIRLNDLIINDFFELYYSKHYAGVCHTQMQYEKTGIAMEGLNTRIVKGLWMAVPPIEEQHKIVEKMMPFIKNMDAIISEKQSLIEDLKAYKKSLIYEVVTGKRRLS